MQCEECKTEITRNADGDERCSCFFNGELTAIGRVTGLVSTHIAEALKRVASETDNNEGYRDGSVMYDELYCQHQDDTSTDALLIIEVKDMTSVPVIRYKGKEVTGNIVVDYHWTTKNGEGIGEHEYELKHVVQSNSKQVPAIKTVSEKVNAKYFKAVKRDTPPSNTLV